MLIQTLETCSIESIRVVQSLKEAEVNEVVINETRDTYRVTATRGSLIYFSVVELAMIDSMYQNSLVYIKKLFNEAIRSVEDTTSIEELLQL